MSNVFKNQTYLRIRLITNTDITGALSTKIYYKKPNGTSGSVTASVESSTTGIIYYDIARDSTMLDSYGIWKFWAYVVFSDARVARGETVEVKILDDSV